MDLNINTQQQIQAASLLFGLVISTTPYAATSGSHYPLGGEGVKAASAPPPGMHYRLYNTWYNADTLTDNQGNDSGANFDLEVYAQVHRFIYVSDYKILGADWAMNVLVPMKDTSISIQPAGIRDSQSFALGDVVLEPFALFWHGERYDAAVALAVIAPSGDYDAHKPASPGLGYWSGMLSLGGTYYLDKQRSWSISTLSRTLVNSDQDETDIKPGEEFILEGGIGKEFNVKHTWLFQPGVSYCAYWQLSDDSKDGPGVVANQKKRTFGLGAELNVFYLPWKVQANLRYVNEFEAKNTPKGESLVLTITKSF
ncbi:SphA family protein [Ferrimonas sp.]|uniref:SphA family protein n=1 Tax=Ferrimonas sp. TaxID=2080861 RepID=UPI003A8D049E